MHQNVPFSGIKFQNFPTPSPHPTPLDAFGVSPPSSEDKSTPLNKIKVISYSLVNCGAWSWSQSVGSQSPSDVNHKHSGRLQLLPINHNSDVLPIVPHLMCMALYLPVIVCFRHCIYTVTELSAVMMYAWSALLRCCLHFVEQWNGHSDLELIESSGQWCWWYSSWQCVTEIGLLC